MAATPALNDAALAVTRSRGLLARMGSLSALLAGLPINATWDTLDVDFSGGATLAIEWLQLRHRNETAPFLDGDLTFSFVDAELQPGSKLVLREPVALELDETNLYVDDTTLAFRWQESNINRWLRRIAADLADESTPVPAEVTLRLLYAGPNRELRLDWAFTSARSVALPGLNITTPDAGRFSLIVTSTPGSAFNRLALVLTLAKDAKFTAETTFGWARDGTRELQNQPDKPPQPLFSLACTTQKAVSLVLLDMNLDQTGAEMPRFFRERLAVLPPLDLKNAALLTQPTPLSTGKLKNWDITFKLNTAAFELPFLNSKDSTFGQSVAITGFNEPAQYNTETETVALNLNVRVKFGPLALETQVGVTFSIETFALAVDHPNGLKLFSQAKQLPDPNKPEENKPYLGLSWRFNGAEVEPNKYHYLTLVTQGSNFQLLQAPGAVFTVGYDGMSEEPLLFNITNFALTPKGISMRTTVGEDPVRLKGINTKFRFRDSGFEIVENEIREFTLAGSGPLPPDLAGDATADIFLRFGRDSSGGLTLQQGGATLKGSKMLDCKASRFRFSVDQIGLKFVNDRGFHLYFTLTGTAEFVLAAGDDRNGALAWLPGIKINMVECPLTGDMSVIARHVDFLITLPKPLSFNFLGCFEMEIRAFGFFPQSPVFNGAPAMSITGQLRFAQGNGDNANSDRDYHKIFVALPEPGRFIPRIHFEQIAVSLAVGELFKLEGMVRFFDDTTIKGFGGQGMLQLPGLPTVKAAFSFVRVRRDDQSPWVRAWFIYLEVGRLSIGVKILPIFIREIGMGFGYRYTIASLSAVDATRDLKALVKKLDTLAKSQADLARLDAWSVDLEGPGESVRWTIVLRAMLSMVSASEGIFYNQPAEENLQNPFLFDVMLAFRSDLTFYISGRAWINTNYNDFSTNYKGIATRPLFSGYMLLVPRQRRFLARLISNEGGSFGVRPALPEFLEQALAGPKFGAGALIEPGLVHFELGWPNQLQWGAKLGPVQARYTAGLIFRIDFNKNVLVFGISYSARGTLKVEGGVSAGVVGVNVRVLADVAWGTRLIGMVDLNNPLAKSVFYGAIGLEIQIDVEIEFWIKLLFFKKSGTISLGIVLTAGLEVGINGVDPGGVGVRGTGTISLRVMGRGVRFSVRFGIAESNVTAALDKTTPYLSIGLEDGEVQKVPGVGGGVLSDGPLRAERAMRRLEFEQGLVLGAAAAVVPFETPHYVIFAIRKPSGGYSHFVIMPKGEPEAEPAEGERPEAGFLPAPPNGEVDHDFAMVVEGLGANAGFTLEQFIDTRTPAMPDEDLGQRETPWVARGDPNLRWRVNWDATVIKAAGRAAGADERIPNDWPLSRYLRYAFRVAGENDTPTSDPNMLAEGATTLADERVYNPTEAAYEAAVRGAYEQFRASPLFKFDKNVFYDQTLRAAFDNTTTVYHQGGTLLDANGNLDEGKKAEAEATQQADQVRSLVIQDIINDLRQYVRDPEGFDTATSVAFQMGLVFRYKDGTPDWLDITEPANYPTIRQRVGPESSAPPAGETAPVRSVLPFTVSRTDFSAFPPVFRRVQQFTSPSTIALAWDLGWNHLQPGECSPAQAEPEHHLAFYNVRRRALDSAERDRVFTVKAAEVLHREAGDTALRRLAPRFQVVDQFANETAEEQAALPATGRSYLYTVTPIDLAGNPGRPLTLVATRFPTAPPRVPVDGKLTVRYGVRPTDVAAANRDTPEAVQPFPPERVDMAWTETGAQTGPAIDTYQLVFRRDSTLPIGSYGLDSTTQRDQARRLPTSSTRPLPTDVVLEITPVGPPNDRSAMLTVAQLRAAGVLPAAGAGTWRSEAWHVYFQTISASGVPSTLTPVQLVLRVEGRTADGAPALDKGGDLRREERQPAALEWAARPIAFPLLPPEDERAQSGRAHFPMPAPGAGFDLAAGSASGITYLPHPAGIRCLRFRWNQGPSGNPAYPLELHAGYHVLELDTDAHTNETLRDPARMANVLRDLQDIRMVPASDLPLIPGDTLATARWEAWYASTMLRRRDLPGQDDPALGTRIGPKPWYSWRESLLEWPALPPGEDSLVDGRAHPFLRAVMAKLAETYLVDLQTVPPANVETFDAFLQASAPKGDPYGWGVLQQFGLSVTFALREQLAREHVLGEALVDALRTAIGASLAESAGAGFQRHLHVELLFQPGRSVDLTAGVAAEAQSLLAIVQLSLRPAVRQMLRFRRFQLQKTDAPNGRVVLQLQPRGAPFSLINLGDPASGQAEFDAGATASFNLLLDAQGQATVLARGEALPEIAPGQDIQILSSAEFVATDMDSVAFGMAVGLETMFGSDVPAGAAQRYRAQWLLLKRYLDRALRLAAANPTLAPNTPPAIKAVLPDVLAWAQRFFDHTGNLQAEGNALPATVDGPWLATAYPRAGSPFYAAPDESGRLAYIHLLADKWAHVYRYYIRPYGRYDALWQSIRTSPALFDDLAGRANEQIDVLPDINAGGLDVALEREERVSRPLVLRSGRLDAAGRPDQPTPPGRTWEVIVAQHPEQSLAERNQTVARQLGFRQVAFTLLRRLNSTYRGWIATLENTYKFDPARIALVEHQYPTQPLLPPPPEALDQLDLATITGDNLRSIDLPLRLASMQHGAMALQWEGLPFYYEHQLLLVAQAAAEVSDVTSVVQQDFAYQSPTPEARMAGQRERPEAVLRPAEETRGRRVRIPLRRFWDALSPEAQQQWPGEEPLPRDSEENERKIAALPDPEVVYQIVESFSGNVEVQAELFFDKQGTRDYARRQLGQRFLASNPRVIPPTTPQGDYLLETLLLQRTEDPLTQAYPLANVPQPTLGNVVFRENVLVFNGVLHEEDHKNLAGAWFGGEPTEDKTRDRQTLDRLLESWRSIEAVSQAFDLQGLIGNAPYPQSVKTDLLDLLRFVPPVECALAWHGAALDGDGDLLKALGGDAEFQLALSRLLGGAVEGKISTSSAPVGLDQVPAMPSGVSANTLEGQLAVGVDGASTMRANRQGNLYTTLSLTGLLSDEQRDRLKQATRPWAQIRVFSAAFDQLLAAADTRVIVLPLPPGRPRQEDLPASVNTQLLLSGNILAWSGPAPSDDQRAALTGITGDTAFQQALAALLATFDTGASVPLNLAADAETPQLALPAEIADRLAVTGAGANRAVTWSGPAPTDAERAALASMATDATIGGAVQQLIDAFDLPRHVDLAPFVRPTPEQLAGMFGSQMAITPTQVLWTGRMNAEQVNMLHDAASQPNTDGAFVQAVGQIIDQMTNTPVTVALNLPARPGPDALGDLKQRLLVGRALLRYHGLMRIDEAQALRELLFKATGAFPDTAAAERLYAQSLNRGMRGRVLRVRARRGTAAPSDMQPIDAETLPPWEV